MLTRNCLLAPRQWTRLCLSLVSCSREVSSFSWFFLPGWTDDDWWVDDWMDRWMDAVCCLLSPVKPPRHCWASPRVPLTLFLSCRVPYKSLVVRSYFSSLVFLLLLFLHVSSALFCVSQWCHWIDPQGPMTTKKIHKLIWSLTPSAASNHTPFLCYFSLGSLSLCHNHPMTK